jgi:hypothetical protein
LFWFLLQPIRNSWNSFWVMVSCLEVSVYKALIRRLCKIERRLNVLKSCYSIWKGGVFQAILVLLLLTGNQGTQMLPSKIYRCFSAPDGKWKQSVTDVLGSCVGKGPNVKNYNDIIEYFVIICYNCLPVIMLYHNEKWQPFQSSYMVSLLSESLSLKNKTQKKKEHG